MTVISILVGLLFLLVVFATAAYTMHELSERAWHRDWDERLETRSQSDEDFYFLATGVSITALVWTALFLFYFTLP